MEKIIRKILKEYVESSLEELMATSHYNQQYNIRFQGDSEFFVKKFMRINNRLDVRTVGTYTLSKEEKSEIDKRVNEVLSIDLPEDLNFGIEVYRFNVDVDKINFTTKDERYETLKDTLRDENPANLYLMDRETESVGDILFFLVKGNKIVTTFLERSYNFESIKEKRNLDYVVTIEGAKKFELPKNKPTNTRFTDRA